MDLSKRLLLLKHINTFIFNQYSEGATTMDILGMLSYKSNHYREKLNMESINGTREDYIYNYSLFLRKRVVDFQYFREKQDLKVYDDKNLFKLIDFRDRIIFNKIF
jgi:hypothetical protein